MPDRKAFSRIFLGDDRRAFVMQPVISIGVIEVPVCVDQVPDRIAADARQRIGDRSARHCNSGINQQLSIRTGEHGDIATGAHQHADVSAQLLDGDLIRRRGIFDVSHDSLVCRQETLRRRQRGDGRETGRSHKMSARHACSLVSELF